MSELRAPEPGLGLVLRNETFAEPLRGAKDVGKLAGTLILATARDLDGGDDLPSWQITGLLSYLLPSALVV